MIKKIKNHLKKYQIFWQFANKLYYFYPLFLLKKLPQEIIIEPTNFCNLRCPVCPTNLYMNREKGYMAYSDFCKIIDELGAFPKKFKISFAFAGEPMLHKEIDKFVDYAKKQGHYVYISTNATLLTKELSEKLILSGLDSIHLCLDGYSKKSHESYRIGSDFTSVKKNIEDFIKIKKILNKNNPKVIIQTLLTSYSENEIEDLTSWAKTIGANGINFKSISLGSFTTDKEKKRFSYLLPKNSKLRRISSNIQKTICTVPLHQFVIYWNGDLGICCIDFNGDIILGNVIRNGIKEIFTLKSLKLRKAAIRKLLPLCKNCNLGKADFVSKAINFTDK